VPAKTFIAQLNHARPDGIGIRSWSIYASESCRLSLGIKDGEAGNAHAPLSMSESCGARYLIVWEDGRISRGWLERRQLAAEPLESLQSALAAAYEDPDAAQVLGPAEIPDVQLHCPEVAEIAQGELGQLATRLDLVRERVKQAEFRTWSGSISAGEGFARITTSEGLVAEGRGTEAGWFVTVNGEIGTGFSARCLDSQQEFESRLDQLMTLAGELQRPAESMTAGRHRLLLHPKVVESYVLGNLFSHLGGSTVAHGESRFQRELFGSDTPVLREDLALRLDPLVPLKSGSYRFTAAGLPASSCSFIDRGRLVQPVLDLKYARRLGLPPTPIPYAMDTVQFTGDGTLTQAEALEEASGGAMIYSVLGAHTQDSASGDFSLSAPLALHINSGRYAGRLRATLSGNLFDLLSSEDLRLVAFDGEHSPGLLVTCRLDPA
jgi:PmbA protein